MRSLALAALLLASAFPAIGLAETTTDPTEGIGSAGPAYTQSWRQMTDCGPASPSAAGGAPSFNCSTVHHYEGIVTLQGDAATPFVKRMTDAKDVPADPNLGKLPLSQTTVAMLEHKTGKDISCYNFPDKTPDGKDFQRDAGGNLVFHWICTIKIRNLNAGSVN